MRNFFGLTLSVLLGGLAAGASAQTPSPVPARAEAALTSPTLTTPPEMKRATPEERIRKMDVWLAANKATLEVQKAAGRPTPESVSEPPQPAQLRADAITESRPI